MGVDVANSRQLSGTRTEGDGEGGKEGKSGRRRPIAAARRGSLHRMRATGSMHDCMHLLPVMIIIIVDTTNTANTIGIPNPASFFRDRQ